MRRLFIAIAAVGLAAMGMATMPEAVAAGTTCNGTITGTTGSLTVPPGGSCELNGATVNGSVTVQKGATLEVHGGTHITGSVTAYTAKEINIHGTTNHIDGGLTMNGTSSDANVSEICGVIFGGSVNVNGVSKEVAIDADSSEVLSCAFLSNRPVTVKGSVTLQNNTATVELSHATVSGSVTVINNSSGDPDGSAEIEGNTIGGTLACSGNVNGVDNGSNEFGTEPNTAKTKTGQCVGK